MHGYVDDVPRDQDEPRNADPALHRPTVTRHVDAPVTAVWDVVSDGWQYATWVVGAARVRDVDEAWPAPGSRLHHSVGMWPLMVSDTTVVEECTPPHRILLTARGWPVGEALVSLEIVEEGPERCRVAIAEDASSGPGRVVPAPVRQLAILSRNRETLRRLALVAEGRHHRSPSGPAENA